MTNAPPSPLRRQSRRIRFTDRTIRGLLSHSAQTDYVDTEFKGATFGLRVSERSKVFYLRYRVGGHQRRHTLGRYPSLTLQEARRAALGVLNKVEHGEDPLSERSVLRSCPTVANFSSEFLQSCKSRGLALKTITEYQRMLLRYIIPEFGRRLISQIRRRDLIVFLESKSGKTPFLARRLQELLQVLFRRALDLELIAVSPLSGVPSIVKLKARERFLSSSELPHFWHALAGISEVLSRSYFRLLLLTGQRVEEVGRMRWSEIDFVAAEWRIPGRRTKNRLLQVVPLGKHALAALEEIRSSGLSVSEYVFESPITGNPIVERRSALRRLKSAIGGDSFQLRDIRRTTQTLLGELGISNDVSDLILNHKAARTGVGYVYQRSSRQREVRAAFEKLDCYIDVLQIQHSSENTGRQPSDRSDHI